MKRASAPESHDDKLCHTIKYPDNIVDKIESKIRYGDAVSSLWLGELLRLKQGAEVRMSEEREKGDTAVPHEEARPRDTIVAADEIRHLTSHLIAIDNTPSVPHEEARPRDTIVAAEEIRHLTSHLIAIDNTPSRIEGWK